MIAHRRQHPRCLALAGLLAWCAGPAAAQEITGRVLDELTEQPPPDALVLVESRLGAAAIRDATDALGNFSAFTDPGGYRLRVIRTGYVDLETPWGRLDEGLVYPLDLLLTPRPVELDEISVTVSPHEGLVEGLGLRLEDLGSRIIPREVIAKRQAARDIGEVLMWQSRTCALFALNGLATTEDAIAMISPEDVESIVVLTPSEASMLFGTGAAGGAVMICTRNGR